ncbi:HAD family hydrolase [Caldimonas thermodepolymerans]|jgi:histidinol-phosphate phosphatase family domain/HAD-superfamily hydrolase, subfamily IIIA|uniref:D,D-heptose 1,7-bisphosphate phosphatase n=1 Tax=Caldimonas thermodepolymerans TaxID=215580 RepID=A0A2S5T472_9BURK|nr:HAD family hydrolase [Caldimonas thermodepolymerans]PPE69781.1 HAD family hydrolase [Caldimonas thermodepolymerans]QPC32615.1 HAD family hydrolase [Caldimonas thermodepolymerans]RDI03364.1 D,D-heptose 1,7-bisphosphate phosphatase [Caldimonas thermodepolymerans]UZG45419.1 HAD family hydrolase [Caldimonas thermodepolymerans]
MALNPDATGGAPAVFLDKDGTVVENVPYNVDPAQLRFTSRAVAGLQWLAEAGYRMVMISNQPGVGLGLFDERALARLQEALMRRLAVHGVLLDGFYACTHAPGLDPSRPGCTCRKPAPGLLLRAAEELHLDLSRSWMVGDILDDVEAGRRAGCRTVMLDVGNETVWRTSPQRMPHHTAPDLLAAAWHITAADGVAVATRTAARLPAAQPRP